MEQKMKTLKTLDTLKNERIIVELNQKAQKNIIGGISISNVSTAPTKINLGTYFDHDMIEE